MNQYKKVAFHTLGCKLNFSETSTIARLFEGAGYARVELEAGPDICVINTCSVTDNADKKCRNLVRKALKFNPEAFVIVIGCYAQLKPQEISKIPGVDMVLGANEKFNVLDHLDTLGKKEDALVFNAHIKETREYVPGYSYGDRTRSFLKVQDGCDYFCSFCTIPLARGRSRSASIADTVKVAQEVAQTDVKEVVLTGVNIGDFGQGTNETFFDLVQELDQLEGIDRFRISSIEPNLLTDDIIEFVADSQRFVPHFHIPLQSGSDHLLGLMRRRYTTELYTNRIRKIKQLMPDCCIGVDVITGFPGETEEEFLTTFNYLNDLPISYLHVFTYSERANTTAIRMENVVPIKTRQERSQQLRILSTKKQRAFYQQNAGQTKPVLFEADENEGMLNGFTDNYVKVKIPYDKALVNQLHFVHLLEVDRDGVFKISVAENTLQA